MCMCTWMLMSMVARGTGSPGAGVRDNEASDVGMGPRQEQRQLALYHGSISSPHFFFKYLCMWVYTSLLFVFGGQRITCRSWFSPSITWVPQSGVSAFRFGVKCVPLLSHQLWGKQTSVRSTQILNQRSIICLQKAGAIYMASYMTFRAGTKDTVHARQPLYQHTIAVAIINILP